MIRPWMILTIVFLLSTVSLSWGHPLQANMDLVDLSYPLSVNTLHWITSRPFEMKVLFNGTKQVNDASFWLQTEELTFNTHTGTHLDAPCHFAYGTWCVSDIPLEHLMDRPVAVVDVSKQCQGNRDYLVTIDDIKRHESKYGLLPDASILLIRTGWSRYWPIKEQYFGTENNDVNDLHFPGIDKATARWLVQNRHVVGVGIEGPSVDGGQSHDKQTHVTLYEHNIYGLENLPNLYRLPMRGATLTVLPLKTERASGSPVRLVANLNPVNGASMATTIHSSMTFLVLLSVIISVKNLP